MYKLHSTYCTVMPYKCIFLSKETGAAGETTKERLRKYPHVSQTQTDKAYHQSRRSHLISVLGVWKSFILSTGLSLCKYSCEFRWRKAEYAGESLPDLYAYISTSIYSTVHGCVYHHSLWLCLYNIAFMFKCFF